jgi:hypothetical protein
MNGAAAQRSTTDLGNLAALTDDVDVMSINITCVVWKDRTYASLVKMISPPFALSALEGWNRVIPRP